MNNPNRRAFLRYAALSAVAVPVLGLRSLLGKEKKPLATAEHGTVLTADAWNAVIRRLNELSEVP